ncbi:MAG: VWA domain-containing protein [Leptospiraceae bacterium]|nr:VWA domain-containing protein [Leptospiraceae bacterium]
MKKLLIKIFVPVLFFSLSIVLISESDLSLDSDRGKVPDYLEKVAGFDPFENECRPKKCSVNINGLAEQEYFVIILDQSISMEEKFAGESNKMDSAKEIIKEFVDKTPSFIRLGMFTYGKNECSPLDEVHSPFGKGGRKKILSALPDIQPSGATPIGASLSSFRELIQNKKGKFNVLLVTDGQESCEGNPLEEAKKLVDLNDIDLGVNFYVAGVGLEKATAD